MPHNRITKRLLLLYIYIYFYNRLAPHVTNPSVLYCAARLGYNTRRCDWGLRVFVKTVVSRYYRHLFIYLFIYRYDHYSLHRIIL